MRDRNVLCVAYAVDTRQALDGRFNCLKGSRKPVRAKRWHRTDPLTGSDRASKPGYPVIEPRWRIRFLLVLAIVTGCSFQYL